MRPKRTHVFFILLSLWPTFSHKLQFDAASPPNPLPHRGGGTSYSFLLSFLLVLN